MRNRLMKGAKGYQTQIRIDAQLWGGGVTRAES